MRGSGNAFRQFQAGKMNGLADVQIAQIDFDEGRQVGRQTGDFQFRSSMVNDAGLGSR